MRGVDMSTYKCINDVDINLGDIAFKLQSV